MSTQTNITGLRRWLRFNLVGAMGIAVQLGALALFRRLCAGSELLPCAAAVELAVLHNFAWHLHYTWSDRRGGASWLQQLLRFHLSNGLVSLAGNLALMRLLVDDAHTTVMLANAIAIVCCGAANFALAHLWAFTKTRHRGFAADTRTMDAAG